MVDAFFERAFVRDLDQRFTSAIEMAEEFSRAAGTAMPSLKDSAMNWDNPLTVSPSGLPPNAVELAEAAQQEATTMPRLPKPPSLTAGDQAHYGQADPQAGGYGPHARHSSDPMFHGAPASSSSYGEPSGGAPAEKPRNVFKGTQPLDAQSLAEANRKGRTVRLSIAQRLGSTASPLPVEPSPMLQEVQGGPPPNSDGRSDGKRVIVDSSRAGSGAYTPPNYQGAAGPPYSSSSPPSSAETLTPELAFQQPGGLRGKGAYVLRGLLVGAGVGALIALIVFLIRS
jgi:hypothetical protein